MGVGAVSRGRRRTGFADLIGAQEELAQEVLRAEGAVVLDQPRQLVQGGVVVQQVLREVDERRVAALRARELHHIADAGARDLVACACMVYCITRCFTWGYPRG